MSDFGKAGLPLHRFRPPPRPTTLIKQTHPFPRRDSGIDGTIHRTVMLQEARRSRSGRVADQVVIQAGREGVPDPW